MYRRQTFVLLSLITILSVLFAGCQPAAAPQPAAETPADTQGQTDEKITLTIWDTGTEYYQWVEDIAIPLFKEKYPNVEIVHTGIPYDQFSLKIDTAATAGDLPDLIADEVPGPNSKWYKAGLFIPLTPYMEKDKINKGDFCGLINTTATYEGNTYLLPMYVNFWAMLYNKKMFQDAGLPELTTDSVITFNDWLDYARKLNKPAETLEERVWGSQLIRPDWNSMPAGMSDPYYLGSDGRTCAGNSDTPDMINAWTTIRDAYKEDLTPETGQALMGDADSWLFFTEGKVAMSYGDMSMTNQAVEKGIDVGITGQPVITSGSQMNTHIYGMGYGITKASKNPDLAWEFVKMTATVIPLKLVGAKEYGEATAGIPCYTPIAEQYIKESNNPYLEDAQKMIARYKAPVFVPDFYAGSTVIWEEINTRVIEGGEDLATVVASSMELCQSAVDDMWEQWDSL
ncbi:MAG: extracellular solute-binding protein, partial [Anaerolineae bacterium]|nr:extracellular solute-binding protein [Anaerolineae bacterium]